MRLVRLFWWVLAWMGAAGASGFAAESGALEALEDLTVLPAFQVKGVRVLHLKVSRSFEVTRTDFKRVVPLEEVVASGP